MNDNKLIQLGRDTFIPNDAKIHRVNSVGASLYVTYTSDEQLLTVGITSPQDQLSALKVFGKMAAQTLSSTPEIDFWINVSRTRK